MYTFVVKQILRSAFKKLNQGNYQAILGQFAPSFKHVFYGEHALGGTRTTPQSNERWYRRLYEIFPDLQFELLNITVNGLPWDTTASVQWIDTFSGPDGTSYSNQGVHIFKLAWDASSRCISTRIPKSWLRSLQHSPATAGPPQVSRRSPTRNRSRPGKRCRKKTGAHGAPVFFYLSCSPGSLGVTHRNQYAGLG